MRSQHSPEGHREPQFRLWLSGCRWALAAGFVLLALAGGSLWKAALAEPAILVPERINPNTASMASLVRLPGVGKVRAMEIINYRQQIDDRPAFESPASLDAIRGIGPKTVEAMSAWLTFDEPIPNTATTESAGHVPHAGSFLE